MVSTCYYKEESHAGPVVTRSSSVLGIRYDGGILIATDTTVSRDRNLKLKGIKRIVSIGEDILIAATGEHAELQVMASRIADFRKRDVILDDGCIYGPRAWHSYINRYMYQQRTEIKPIFGTFVVAGKEDNGELFLGSVDVYGTALIQPIIATGFGSYLALPLLRKHAHPDITETEARELLKQAFVSIATTDNNSSPMIIVAKITKEEGVTIEEPTFITADWSRKSARELRYELPICNYNF